MKLLTSVMPRGTRLLLSGCWFTLAFAGCLVGLEVLGRHATSDIHDGLAALALVAAGIGVAMRHKREPLPWVRSFLGWGRRRLTSLPFLHYDHGVDLRGTPPVSRRTPRFLALIILGLVAWGVLAGIAWFYFPTGWRELGVRTSYVLYLLGLLVLWTALLACTFIGVFIPVAVLDRHLKGWVGDTDRRGAELAAVVGYAVLVSAVAWVVPPVAIIIVCLVVAGLAGLAFLPKGKDTAAILWRREAGQPISAVPLHRVLALLGGLSALLLFDILLTACGGRLLGTPADNETMPVTALLGSMAAWLVPGLLIVAFYRIWNAWKSDPARRARPVIQIFGANTAARERAAAKLRAWGWKARTRGDHGDPGTIGIEIVEPEESEATEFDPRWPLRVSEADLEEGIVRERLERRDEIQLRRQFFRALAKLFTRASAFKSPGGGGLWLAPHWWFIEGLGREDSESGDDEAIAPPLVGPPYHRVFPTRSRQHFHQVLRSTQVDMIFIEDGVGYRKLEKVLRVLLELYDVHGGKRKAEELHFLGLPKVRVMIHDYEPGNPFESDVYPEPKFDELSRVRVLHIFRDRGGHEERVEPPFDFSWTPAPVGAMG